MNKNLLERVETILTRMIVESAGDGEIVELEKPRAGVHPRLVLQCKDMGLNFYVVDGESVYAATTKSPLRRFNKMIYRVNRFEPENPDTWDAQYGSKKKYGDSRWSDMSLAANRGLRIPD